MLTAEIKDPHATLMLLFLCENNFMFKQSVFVPSAASDRLKPSSHLVPRQFPDNQVLTFPRRALSHMEHTAGDCACRACRHNLKYRVWFQ